MTEVLNKNSVEENEKKKLAEILSKMLYSVTEPMMLNIDITMEAIEIFFIVENIINKSFLFLLFYIFIWILSMVAMMYVDVLSGEALYVNDKSA